MITEYIASLAHQTQTDEDFAVGFNQGYQAFKIGIMLKQAREDAGITQDELAERLHTKKSAISRMEISTDWVASATK